MRFVNIYKSQFFQTICVMHWIFGKLMFFLLNLAKVSNLCSNSFIFLKHAVLLEFFKNPRELTPRSRHSIILVRQAIQNEAHFWIVPGPWASLPGLRALSRSQYYHKTWSKLYHHFWMFVCENVDCERLQKLLRINKHVSLNYYSCILGRLRTN